MNEEFLIRARENSPKSEFIRAYLSNIPLPDNSVPILFSSRIFQCCNEGESAIPILDEAYRILKPADSGIYLAVCENFSSKERINFLRQVETKGFKILKDDSSHGMIYNLLLQK